ncbi:hypothetical protein PENSPDRAFT_693241 [Peniophora sp. CONT]|nr:hypothetical protein PENSPDRAFT_693241 [Peniophora sp. CONT]
MSTSNTDVLVVGAGPVGLVAALVLAQNDVSIRIIDQLPNFDNIGQRGASLQPRSLEAYKFLGVLDDLIKKGTFDGLNIRSYDVEGKLANEAPFRTKQPATPEIPLPNGMTLGQDSNCAIMRRHLGALGVEVEVATEMVTYEQDANGVTATIKANGNEEKVQAKFLLGTDGAKGITRRTSGIRFVGETKEIRAVIGDVELAGLEGPDKTMNRQIMHTFTDTHKNRVLIRPIPEDPSAYFLMVAGVFFDLPRFVTDKDHMQEQLRLISHRPELVVSKIRNLAEWRLNERVADHLMVGRVLIAGDAAHCHSPTGGQGLNSGVIDAMNIAWKLASVIKHNSPLSLLSTYEEERLPVIREMLRITTDMADKAFKTTDMSTAVWQRPLALRQLGVHCRWSGIVRDEVREGELVVTGTSVEPEDVYGSNTSQRLHAGDRAPDAPGLVDIKTGESTELFNIFKPTYHTIIVLDAAALKDVLVLSEGYPEGSVRVVAALPDGHGVQDAGVYTDSQGHAQRAYGVEAGVKIATVRPDGVVGGLLKGTDGIQQYFTKIFA